jgi:hypothetical protein
MEALAHCSLYYIDAPLQRILGLDKLVGLEDLASFRLLHEFWFVSDALSRVIGIHVCFGPRVRVNLPFVVDLCFIV